MLLLRLQRGGEYPLVGDTAGRKQNPSVSVTSKGGLVAWQNATADSGGERIVIQSLGPDYRRVGAPKVVSQNITGQNDLNPSISVLPEDRYAVVWESGPRSSSDIFIRILDAQGQFLTEIQKVNSYHAGVQSMRPQLRSRVVIYWWCGQVMGRMARGRGFTGSGLVERELSWAVNFE